MTEDIKYTPKQISHSTGIGYRKILKDIKDEVLKAKKDNGEQSFIIYQEDLVDYLASLDEDLKDELIISFKGKVPKAKIKEVTEELVDTFNKVKDNKDKITVLKDNVENINIEVKSDYFVAIELENEIQGFMPLQLQGVQAQKLNNKTIVIYTYNDNLPKNLGKIIITDSNCNKYSLNLKENEKITKDTSIYIKNSNTEKKCEALSKDNSYFPRAGAVTYDVIK